MVRQRLPRQKSLLLQSHREGVSLLEIMVAMTLAIVMMGAIWSLANLLTRRHEGQIRLAEQGQITRSLHQRLTQDLNSLVTWDIQSAPTPVPEFSDGEMHLPAFPFYLLDNLHAAEVLQSSASATLTGTETELSLQVYIDPFEIAWQMYQEDDQEFARDEVVDDGSLRPSFTRRVRYSLVRPPSRENAAGNDSTKLDWEQLSEESGQPQAGFTREEWDNPADRSALERRGEGLDTSFDKSTVADSRRSPNIYEKNDSEPSAGYRVERIEEIAEAQFRYFDGRRWRRRWDSLQDGRLPHAILFQFSFAQRKSRHEDQEFETYSSISGDDLRDTEPEDEFDDLEIGELPTDERFEFAYLLRIQTPMSRHRQEMTPIGFGIASDNIRETQR